MPTLTDYLHTFHWVDALLVFLTTAIIIWLRIKQDRSQH